MLWYKNGRCYVTSTVIEQANQQVFFAERQTNLQDQFRFPHTSYQQIKETLQDAETKTLKEALKYGCICCFSLFCSFCCCHRQQLHLHPFYQSFSLCQTSSQKVSDSLHCISSNLLKTEHWNDWCRMGGRYCKNLMFLIRLMNSKTWMTLITKIWLLKNDKIDVT